jgi:hypothetical protein
MTDAIPDQGRFWYQRTCTNCGGEAGDTDTTKLFVHAGFGSRHDTNLFVWTAHCEDIAPCGYLCDDCLEQAVSEGRLEAFVSETRDETVGLNLSIAAYKRLFSHGARNAYDDFWYVRGDEPYHEARDPAGLEPAIVAMRDKLGGDVRMRLSSGPTRKPLGWGAVSAGYAHAVAAIALGCGEVDPDFEAAAETWARQRQEAEREQDEANAESKEMLKLLLEYTETYLESNPDELPNDP